MRGIILAAGRGSRMRSFTKDKPKCLNLYKNKTLINYTIENLKKNNINQIGIVTGYKRKKINLQNFKEFHNNNWKRTSILYSLICAQYWLKKSTCIVSYSDIFYEESAIRKIKEKKGDIVLLYDPNWLKLWRKRFKDPTKDAETFEFDSKNNLTSIGSKTNNLDIINGQYMGIFKITPNGWLKIKKYLRGQTIKNIKKMDMTNFFSEFITGSENKIKVVPYEGFWFEIDRISDLKILNSKN